jgi:glycosyltransferase involved in cell wall biosynthesis
MSVEPEPVVSVIIPARNEEENIGKCLQSILDQRGIDFEVIVVDDASTDLTAEIARCYKGVQVIPARLLPAGWIGKSNAICTGVAIARGRWYLFTDADTEHRPGSLSGSIAEAQAQKVILLSYSPEQKTGGWWDKLLQPLIFAELNRTFDYKEVSDPNSSVAAANGQYLLFERDAYNKVGGHAAVWNSMLEDVDLARLAKAVGRIRFRYAPEAVACRMYRSFSELRAGWSKNLALLFPNSRSLAALRGIEFLSLLGGPFVAAKLLVTGLTITGLVITGLFVRAALGFAQRLKRGGFGLSSLISFVGLPLYAYLLLRSVYARHSGGVTWKGRTYPSSRGFIAPKQQT